MKNKIIIDTQEALNEFVEIAKRSPGSVFITDNNGTRLDVHAVLDSVHILEFKEIWVESEVDIYSSIEKFVAHA